MSAPDRRVLVDCNHGDGAPAVPAARHRPLLRLSAGTAAKTIQR